MSRIRYSTEEDQLIKKLTKKNWSTYEVSYQIFKQLKVVRFGNAISQRRARLVEDGQLETPERGKRYVTQEALTWYNKQFDANIGPASNLELTEHKSKPNGKAEEAANGSHGSYTVQMLRLQRSSPQLLNLFKDLLEAGVNESKTAPDIIDDLAEASA